MVSTAGSRVMPQETEIELSGSPTCVALRAAIRQSNKTRYAIAHDTGISERTLRRWLTGEVAPTTEQWAATMKSCGVSPAACFLAAELGRADLIGTQSYEYIDLFIHHMFTRISGLEDAGEMPLDPRGAARDASIVSDSWSANYQRRKRFMDEEYAKTGLPAFDRRS